MHETGSFGAWLRQRRRELDLTQAELAQRAGCSKAAIRKIEADERKPSQQLADLLAKALRIPDEEKKGFIEFARHIRPGAQALSSVAETIKISDLVQPALPANNLPAFLTSLVDRTQDIATVLDLIIRDEARWVTLIGPPGIGKTRLSIHCGEQALSYFRDGVWFVDLSTIREADFVLPAIGRVFSHLNLPQSPSMEQLTVGLKNKELLLVLDNFEQVENAAGDVAVLLKGCPKIKVLVSSRVPLNVYGEYKYFVPTLSVPPRSAAMSHESLMQFESVQLFAARARQFQTGFEINAENAATIVEICTRMDGIPLALELAAASLRHMDLGNLAEIFRSENRLNWLRHINHPARDLPPRQQTLENVIAWSYTLLTPERQRFFRRLGIFTGLFDDDAATVICAENGTNANQAREELEYLAEHSLLQQSQVDGHRYWHMLEIIHEFALLQITPAERSDTEARHAGYYHSLLENVLNSSVKIHFGLFFQVHGDDLHKALRRAISTSEADLAFSLAIDLGQLWEHVGYLREGMDLIRQVLSMPGKVDDGLRIELLERAATLAWQQHSFELALSLTDEAMEVVKAGHLNGAHPFLLNLKGRILIEEGNYHEAYEALSACYDLSLRNPETFDPGVPLAQLGEVELALGNYDQSRVKLLAALDYLKNRNEIFSAVSMTDLAEVALAARDYDEARHYLQLARDVVGRHVRRLLCYLSTLAGYLTLGFSDDQKLLLRAVEIYGAVEALKEYSGEVLVPFYVDVNASRIALTRRNLGQDMWQTAWETGRKWERGEMLARAVDGLFDKLS